MVGVVAAIGIAIVAVIVVTLCWCCYCYDNDEPKYYMAEPKYYMVEPKYIMAESSRQFQTGDCCTLDEAATAAFNTGSGEGTVLYDNIINKIYWSTKNKKKHAEEVFLEKGVTGEGDELYFKNSPCENCTNKLIEHYGQITIKPTIYIGKIWKPQISYYNAKTELRKLKKNGFRLKTWSTPINNNSWEVHDLLEKL